jgi:GNAT superfamily N-acetyltransferase
MKIYKATKKDLKEISQVHLIETAKKPYFQKWNEETAFKKIKELFEKGEIYFIKLDGKIAGYIAVFTAFGSDGKTVIIDEIWIKEKYQGKGYGTKLINFMGDTYRKKGIKSMSLISNRKSKAFGFYKKIKFIPDLKEKNKEMNPTRG